MPWFWNRNDDTNDDATADGNWLNEDGTLNKDQPKWLDKALAKHGINDVDAYMADLRRLQMDPPCDCHGCRRGLDRHGQEEIYEAEQERWAKVDAGQATEPDEDTPSGFFAWLRGR